jgi:hypothetical protein
MMILRKPGEFVYFVLFFFVSIPVFLVWTHTAKTEVGYSPDRDGKNANWSLEPGDSAGNAEKAISWRSVSGMIYGSVPSPFIKRRLLPTTAWLLSKAIPSSFWSSLASGIGGQSRWQRMVRSVIEGRLGWRPDRYPVLFSAYFLIWASIIGFMYSCRSFTSLHYQITPWVGIAVPCVLAIGLLGGTGDWNQYPYDLPHAFVFLLALNGIIGRQWWLWPAFLAAAYSKETSVLLILAHALIWRKEVWTKGYWGTLAGLSIIYGVVRLWIDNRYPIPSPHPFWFPFRNAVVLRHACVWNIWFISIIAVILLRMLRLRERIPYNLRLLLLLVPIMLGFAFFKGWIEERRAYLEIYPIAGLILIQWASMELGFDRFLIPRDAWCD